MTKLFSKVTEQTSTNTPLMASPMLVLVCLFDYSSQSECEVVFHWAWVCISLKINDLEHIFMYLLAICISFFGEIFIQILGPF
jgi:hypothetical protein